MNHAHSNLNSCYHTTLKKIKTTCDTGLLMLNYLMLMTVYEWREHLKWLTRIVCKLNHALNLKC